MVLAKFIGSHVLNSWSAHAHLKRESCSFVVDVNVPGKSNSAPMNLTAAVWTLSRSLRREREIGETVYSMWPDDGQYYAAEITEKHADGTYDLHFREDDVVVKRVHPRDIDSATGTSPTHLFAHESLTYSLTRSVQKYAIEFTDPSGMMASPSVPLNTWVLVGRSTPDTIMPPKRLTTGDVIVLNTNV